MNRLKGIEEAESGEGSVLWSGEQEDCVDNEELGRCGGVMDRPAFIERAGWTNACSSEREGGGVERYTETDEVWIGDGV